MYSSNSEQHRGKCESTKENINKSSTDIARQYSGLLDVLQQQYHSRSQDHNYQLKNGNNQDNHHYNQDNQDCFDQRKQPPILISRQKLKYQDDDNNNNKDCQRSSQPISNENYFDRSLNVPSKKESLSKNDYDSRIQQFQISSKPPKFGVQLRSYSYFPHSKLSTFEEQSQSSQSDEQNEQVTNKDFRRTSKLISRDQLKSKGISDRILEKQLDMKKTIDLRTVQQSMSASQDHNSHRNFNSQDEQSSIQQLGTFRESLWKPSITSSRSNKNNSTSQVSAENNNTSKTNYDTFQEPQVKQECSYHYRKDKATAATTTGTIGTLAGTTTVRNKQHKNHNLVPTSKISCFVVDAQKQPQTNLIQPSFNIVNASLRPPKWEGTSVGANKENKENENDYRNLPWKEINTDGKTQESILAGNHISLKTQQSRHQHQSYASLDQSDSVVLFENSFSEIMDPSFEQVSQPSNQIEQQEMISIHRQNHHYPQEWWQNNQKQQQHNNNLSRRSGSVNRNHNINLSGKNTKQQQGTTLFKNESSLSTTLASSFSQTIVNPLGLSSQRSQLASVAAFSPFDYYCNNSIPQGDYYHQMLSKPQENQQILNNRLLGMSSNSLVNYEDPNNIYDNLSHNLHSVVNSKNEINLTTSPIHQSGHFLQPDTEIEYILATEKAQQHNEVNRNECDMVSGVAPAAELVNFCSFAEVKRKLEMSIAEENIVSDEKMQNSDDTKASFWRKDINRQINRHSLGGQLSEKTAEAVQKAVLKVTSVMRKANERLMVPSFKRIHSLQYQQYQAHNQGQILHFTEYLTEKSQDFCKNKITQQNQQILIRKLTGILQLSIKLRDITTNRLQFAMVKINNYSMRMVLLKENINRNTIQNESIRVALGLVNTFNNMISQRNKTIIQQANTAARILTKVLITRIRKDCFTKWKSMIIQRNNYYSKQSGNNSKYASKSPKYNVFSFCESHSDNNNLWSFNAKNIQNQLEFQENQTSLYNNQRQIECLPSFDSKQNKRQHNHNIINNPHQNHCKTTHLRSNFSEERAVFQRERKEKGLIVPPSYWHSKTLRSKSVEESQKRNNNKAITDYVVIEPKTAKFSPSFHKHQQKYQ